MIVDSSALIAILKNEPTAEVLARAIENAEVVRISAATYLETCIVVDRYKKPILQARLEEILSHPALQVEPVTREQADIAREAYRNYGRGSGHAAKLNYGDCFSYALARVMREPMLFTGDDFRHTDIRSA